MWGLPWVALGHFDLMYVYPLQHKNESFFAALQRNNEIIAKERSGSTYLHPLYLISDVDVKTFWNDPNPYMAIMRIHFAESVEVLELFNSVKTSLSKICGREDCNFAFFRTIELSDMILVVRAQKLSSVVSVALNLRQCPQIGKVYTYCSIRGDVIQRPDDFPEVKDDTDKLALTSVRFSVCDFLQAKQQIENIQLQLHVDDAYIITGVDDLMVNAPSIQTQHLIDLYHWWFVTSDSSQTARAFSDITTRVGILSSDFPHPAAGCNPSYLLKPICDELSDLCATIFDKYNQSKLRENSSAYEWVSLLPELANTFVRMSAVPMLDEFIYLMLPGVRAFLQNTDENLFYLEKEDCAVCREFVDNWISLMEHIMRVEGQLAHHPELRPTLYDIPVVMLEYTLAFLWQVTKFFQECGVSGELQSSNMAFLLVPRLGSHIKAQELFRPNETRLLSGLVLVTIPLQSLYRPEEVQWNLVHEASHFVGEHCRNRKERLHFFVRSIAPIISKKVYGNSYIQFCRAIEDELNLFLNDIPEFTMKVMVGHINVWLKKLADIKSGERDALYACILRRAIKERRAQGKEGTMPLSSIRPQMAVDAETIACIDTVRKLYREVYADLCMLVLLPIDATKYVNSILNEVTASNRSFEEMAIRVYAVLSAMGFKIPCFAIDERSSKFAKEISDIANGERKSKRFPPDVSRCLIEYLRMCYVSLREQLNHPNLQSVAYKIKKMYTVTSNEQTGTPDKFDYDLLLKYIDEYRAEIISHEVT